MCWIYKAILVAVLLPLAIYFIKDISNFCFKSLSMVWGKAHSENRTKVLNCYSSGLNKTPRPCVNNTFFANTVHNFKRSNVIFKSKNRIIWIEHCCNCQLTGRRNSCVKQKVCLVSGFYSIHEDLRGFMPAWSK